jgi:N utilization substance protein A
MSKEILLVVELVSNEKGVSPEVIFESLEYALETAVKKKYSNDIDVKASIDRKTGDQTTVRRKLVVNDEEFDPENINHIKLSEAKQLDENVQVNDTVEETIDSREFSRVATQMAKQSIFSKIKLAEKVKSAELFKDKVGTLVKGTVKKVTRDKLIVDLANKAEGIIKKDLLIPKEHFRTGDHIKAFLKEIVDDASKPQIILSRIEPRFIIELFRLEVPEILEEIIEIKSASRDPGSRAKISVKTNDGRIDPIGACVGMRGSRVQAVSNELCNERVDVVLYDQDPVQYAINAMQPAEVISVIVDENNKSMDLVVSEDNLAQSIGRGGQNVKLASDLIGWQLNVMSEKQAVSEKAKAIESLISMLDITNDLAKSLYTEGFQSLKEIDCAPAEEFASATGVTLELAKELQAKAKDKLLTLELAKQEKLEASTTPSEDLLNMEGMDADLATKLARNGIISMEDLADQSIDELLVIEGIDVDKAGELIMTARKPWFDSASN